MCGSKTRSTPTLFQSDVMDFEQRLSDLAERYRAQGYTVTVHPAPADLPDFAKDFKIEILARRGDVSVLASVKNTQFDLQADLDLPRYAEVIGEHPGWRYDLIVLGPAIPATVDRLQAPEPSDDEIHRWFDDIERMQQAGFVRQAFMAGWALLEAAMRRRLAAQGEPPGWGSSPKTMLNELYSGGLLKTNDFRSLDGLLHERKAIAHGFAPVVSSPLVASAAIQLLVDTARSLLDESRAAKKTA